MLPFLKQRLAFVSYKNLATLELCAAGPEEKCTLPAGMQGCQVLETEKYQNLF